MSRPPHYERDTSLTITNCVSATSTSNTQSIRAFHGYYEGNSSSSSRKIVETKKEKTDRISKEKMLTSWKVYDQKTLTVIKVKQMCKPVHRITNGAFRGLR